MTLENAIKKIQEYEALSSAYNHAMGVLSLDGETVAPRGSSAGRGKTLGVLSGITFNLLVNPEMKEALDTVLDNADNCDKQLVRQAEVIKEGYDADIVIFDYDALHDPADYVKPNQLTEGIEQVIVNGKVVYENMQLTGECAGRVIRYGKE